MPTAIKRGFSGFDGQNKTPQSSMRVLSNKNVTSINALANRDGITPQTAAMKVLRMSQDELIKFIQMKHEVPVNTFSGKVLQATLLRMEDVSVISRSFGMTEDSALAHIEEAESEAVKCNTASKLGILTPSTQGALMIIQQELLKQVKASAGTTGISDSLDVIRKTMATPKEHNIDPSALSMGSIASNSFDGSDDTNDDSSGTTFGTLAPISIAAVGATGPAADTSTTVFAPGSSVVQGSNTGVNGALANGTQVVGTTDGTDIWAAIGTLASNAGSIASSIKSVGSTLVSTSTGLNGVLNNIGGNIGAQAIEDFLTKNWVYLVVAVILIAFIIIMFARAAH